MQVEDIKVPDTNTKVPGHQDKHLDIVPVHHQKLQEEITTVEVDRHHVITVQVNPRDHILELEGRHVHAQGI